MPFYNYVNLHHYSPLPLQIIIMADRLNKLSEYLNSQNLQQAIQVYRNNTHLSFNLDDQQRIKLAKANFFISQDYKQTIDILSKVKEGRFVDLNYQIRILQAKALYMLGEKTQGAVEKLEDLRRSFGAETQQNTNYLSNLKEIVEMINYTNKNSSLTSSSIQVDERRQFQRLMKEDDDNSIISEGMPRFLISQSWFDAWKAFTSNQRFRGEKRHPGPITQFDVLDHPFSVFYDSSASKDYTNRFVFPAAKYELVPKKAWTYLRQKYGGIQVKRYNVSFVDKPYEIVTEVHLKRIQIARKMKDRQGQKLEFVIVQITKKETWKGLKDKLAKAWGQGEIYQEAAKMNILVNDGEILEEIDTVGKRYLYIEGKGKTQGTSAKAVERCGSKQCGKTENLVYCKCKTIKYCNMNCLKADYKNHKKKCQLQTTHQKQQSAMFQNFSLQLKDYSGRKGRVGLKNLGNTCYMNSGLQCLSNTKEMTEYFMRDDFKNHINYSNPLGAKGNLACAYAELIREIWTGSNEYVSPFKLKKMIGNFATQFSGFGQQDSQEFISYLIDGLSQDLNLVKKKQTFETSDDIKSDQQMSKESEINYEKRILSYVRNLMVGQFKSTVVCSSCKKISVCFDPFLLISLPIPTKDETQIFFVPFDFKRGAIKFTIQFNRTTTLKKVTDELVQKYNKKLDYEKDDREVQRLREDRLLYVLIHGQSFQIDRYLDGREAISSLKGKNYVFCLQVPAVSADHEIYLLEFTYQKQNIGFPRFFRLPRKGSTKTKEEIVTQILQRAMSKDKASYNEIINGQKLVQEVPFKKFVLSCQKKVKLLTYVDSQKENIRNFMQMQDAVLNFDDCLNNFAQQQNLAGENLWYCGKCKEHKEATRKLQIYKSNKILVVAFKRFNRYQKIRTPVKFPIEGVNFGPYLLSNKSKSPILYDLYGVVNHYGTMGGGHYTAYCQNFLDQRWYEFNDSRVSQIKRSEVISGDAYVLFFRRRD